MIELITDQSSSICPTSSVGYRSQKRELIHSDLAGPFATPKGNRNMSLHSSMVLLISVELKLRTLNEKSITIRSVRLTEFENKEQKFNIYADHSGYYKDLVPFLESLSIDSALLAVIQWGKQNI